MTPQTTPKPPKIRSGPQGPRRGSVRPSVLLFSCSLSFGWSSSSCRLPALGKLPECFRGAPPGSENSSFFSPFFASFFVLLFTPFLSPSGTLFGFTFPLYFHLKTDTFLRPLLGSLFYGFWAPRPLKMELSCIRNAHFHKIALPAVRPFLHAKYTKNTVQKASTINEKAIKKRVQI